MASPIADRTNECLSKYEKVLALEASLAEHARGGNAVIHDSNSRFQIWVANIGAYHPISDTKSADYRLRDAPAIVKLLTNILDELSETLNDIQDIVTAERPDQSLVQGSHDPGSYTGEPASQATSELSELCDSLPDLVTSLLKVSIFIRKGTTRDRYARAAAAQHNQFLPEFDIRHVADKYPKTAGQGWLQERLGNAITQRRQFLRYVRHHHDKIAKRPLQAESVDPDQAQYKPSIPASRPSQQADSSRRTLAPTTASTLNVLEIQPEMSYDLDEEFDDERSHTTSFVSSQASDGRSEKLQVVHLNELRKDSEEFECPYCREIVRARRNRAWSKHVFRDLRAYACTYEHCISGLFEDKASWFRHELEHHRRQWICTMCPNKSFQSALHLRQHLSTSHSSQVDEESKSPSVESIVDASSRPVTEIAASSCALCDTWDSQLRKEASAKGIIIPEENAVMMQAHQFKEHLAGHQEQLALFAIAPTLQRDIESDHESHQSETAEKEQRILAFTSSQSRTMVYCHQCELEWYRDEHGMTCPECQSDFTELIEPGHAPPDDRSDDPNDQSGPHIDNDSDPSRSNHRQVYKWQDFESDSLYRPENSTRYETALDAAVEGKLERKSERLKVETEEGQEYDFGTPGNPQEFFNVGRVFSTLPNIAGKDVSAGTPKTRGSSATPIPTQHFIVIHNGDRNCSAVRILKYIRPKIEELDDSVRMTSAEVHVGPSGWEELETEMVLTSLSYMGLTEIRVDLHRATAELPESSCIDFARIYDVDHTTRVESFGMVRSGSMSALLRNFAKAQNYIKAAAVPESALNQVDLLTPQDGFQATQEDSRSALASPTKTDDESMGPGNLVIERALAEDNGDLQRSRPRPSVLILSWDQESSQFDAESEVSELIEIFRSLYGFNVHKRSLNINFQRAHLLLEKAIVDFIHDEDVAGGTLIIYYAGHGGPVVSALRSAGARPFHASDEMKESVLRAGWSVIYWDSIERNFVYAESRVLLICDVTRLGFGARNASNMEYIVSCSHQQTPRPPGPDSFTSAVIWALKSLSSRQRFSSSDLFDTILKAPRFENQGGALWGGEHFAEKEYLYTQGPRVSLAKDT